MALKVLLTTAITAFIVIFIFPEAEADYGWTAGSKKHKEPCAETFHQSVVKRISYGEHHAVCKGTVVRYKCTDNCAVKNHYGNSPWVGSYKKGYRDYNKGDGNSPWVGSFKKGYRDYSKGEYKNYKKGNDWGYDWGYDYRNSAGYRGYKPGYRVFPCCGPTHYKYKKQHVHFNCGRYGHKKLEWITKEPVGCNCKFC